MARQRSFLLPLIIVVALLGAIGFIGYATIPQVSPLSINQVSNATGEVTLALSPSTVNVTSNTETSLNLTADTGNVKLVVLTVELNYDPGKIKDITVTQGSMLGNILDAPKSENGKITFTYAASPETGGVKGGGNIATIKFKGNGSGTSALTFSDKTIATAVTTGGERITSNSLRSATDATLTIGSSSTTTNPSPSTAASTTPAQNNVVTTTSTPAPKKATPKPTKKPAVAIASIAPSTSLSPSPSTTDDEPVVTTSTTREEPNFFQKILLGWLHIFRVLFGYTA